MLREMMYVCRPAGILSIPGVYGGVIDRIPFGAAMNKGLTFRMGQTYVKRWGGDLLIEDAGRMLRILLVLLLTPIPARIAAAAARIKRVLARAVSRR